MNSWSGLPSTAPRTMVWVWLMRACIIIMFMLFVVPCAHCALTSKQVVVCKARCRLAHRHGVPWKNATWKVRCNASVCMRACLRLMHIRCVQHRGVLHVAVNRNWGILGSESVADLFHHAPVLKNVDIGGATHGCLHVTLHSHASVSPPWLCPTPLAFVFLFRAHTPPPCVHPPFIL